MKSLFVTYFHVPLRETDRTGIIRRYEPIIRGLSQVSDSVTAVHIVPPEQVAENPDEAKLSREHSEFWGVPMQVRLISRDARPSTTWGHYGPGTLRASAQPRLSAYGGQSVAQQLARHLASDPDLVLAQELPSMVPLLGSGIVPRRLIYDMVDLPHSQVAREAFTPPFYLGKYAKLLHLPALVTLLKRCVATADVSLVCSTVDKAKLRTVTRAGRCEIVRNAIRFPDVPPAPAKNRSILFLGDATYPPNCIGAERMVNEIWPLVLRAVPEARLTVAGKGSEHLPSASTGMPGVDHLGFVHDLESLYARTQVVCCPLLTGGGTRLKLVEAGAYARPIVSTTIGAEGLGLIDGQHALLRDDVKSFAAGCIKLLQDPGLCSTLAEAGRAHLKQQFDSWEVEQQIVELIRSLA
jgi:glycosyltransferase involved in cell wall biosynthesis